MDKIIIRYAVRWRPLVAISKKWRNTRFFITRSELNEYCQAVIENNRFIEIECYKVTFEKL